MHPIAEAEKVFFNNNNELVKAGKVLKEKESNGEFIGMIKLNSAGCEIFKTYYKIAKKKFLNKRFFNAKKFTNAYITDFLNFLVYNKIKIKCAKIKGGWMEIDTIEDYLKAQSFFGKN